MSDIHPAADNPASSEIKCPDSQCVLWTGAHTKKGYGIVRVGKTTTSAHRFAWIKANGPIPDGLEVDHLCRNRLCINIDHLELVTSSENNRRSPRWQVTHCPQGHPLEGDNLFIQISPNGQEWRSCRTCRQERSRKARTR